MQRITARSTPIRNAIRTTALGLAGAGLATVVGLPAGALIGAFGAAALYGLIAGASSRAPALTQFGLALLGTGIGMRITPETLGQVGTALPWAVACTIVSLATGTGIALLVARSGRSSIATAVLGLAPGGAGEMSATATRRGADGPTVLALHLTRVFLIVALVPIAAALLQR